VLIAALVLMACGLALQAYSLTQYRRYVEQLNADLYELKWRLAESESQKQPPHRGVMVIPPNFIGEESADVRA
jgi:hypothetical protein